MKKVVVIYPPITCINLPSLTGLYICRVLNRSGISTQYWDLNGMFFEKYYALNNDLNEKLNQYKNGDIDTKDKWTSLQLHLSIHSERYYRETGIKIFGLGKVVYLEGNEYVTYIRQFMKEKLVNIDDDVDAICIQTYSSIQLEITKHIIPIIKDKYPNVKIIIGGEYLKSCKRNFDTDIYCCKDVGEIVQVLNGTRPEVDISLAHDYKYSLGFSNYYIQSHVFPLMLNATCCYGHCRFCYNGYKVNNVIKKSTEQLQGEIEYLVNNFKATKFRFWDECLSVQDILYFINLIKEKGYKFKWYMNTRFYGLFQSSDFVTQMRRSGCVGIFLGLECASDSALVKMNKGIKMEIVHNALKRLKQEGIKTHISLLFGFPGITEQEYSMSQLFICNNLEYIDYIDVNWLYETSYNKCSPDMGAINWYENMKIIVNTYDKNPHEWKYAQMWKYN